MTKISSERVYEILEKLISFPTVSGDIVELDACVSYIGSVLEASGLQVRVMRSQGVPSLVATSNPGSQLHSKLLLQAHLDVVPAPQQLFSMQHEADRLIGRGTFDMKFAAACFMAVAEAYGTRNAEYDYAIMLSCDEEIGGTNGVKYLLESEGYTSDVCLLPDGATDWAIEEDAKGAWFVRVSATGRSAHGSRPWEGDSAVHKLLDFLQAVRDICAHKLPTDPSLVISQINAGKAINQMPDVATATIDTRFMNADGKQYLQNCLYELATQHDVILETEQVVEASHLDVALPQVAAWKEAVIAATDLTSVNHGMSLGASDAHYFSEHNIPTIVTRPRGGSPHGSDEWIDEQDLYKFAAAIATFIPKVALADPAAK